MTDTYIRVPTTAQTRALERAWIDICHPNWGMVLMEQAGMAAAKIAAELCVEGGGAAIFCGRGNNGGDGLVIARHLQRLNVPISVFLVQSAQGKSVNEQSESAINQRILESALGIQIQTIADDNFDQMREALYTCDLAIDALLGTGLDREVQGIYAELIQMLNKSEVPILSVDLPSGINSDTGQIMGIAIEADATVTFGSLKAGLLHYPGAANAGTISLIDIGAPSVESLPPALAHMSALMQAPIWGIITSRQIAGMLPDRPASSHKGTFGRLLCVAGSGNMPGSAMLAAKSAMRSGTGIVVLATASSLLERLPAEEIIYHPLAETSAQTISSKALDEIENQLSLADAVILGPGLSTNEDTQKLVGELLTRIDKPCIIDADGLNIIARLGSGKRPLSIRNPANFVLTPHPKELSRLLECSVSEIQADRFKAAQSGVNRFGCNIVLKGAHSVVGTSQGQSFLVLTGNNGMATAGSGDVLSGIIGALLAQGVSPESAAMAGAYIHGAAGDLAAADIGEDGLIASDVANHIASILLSMRMETFIPPYLETKVLA